MESINRGELLRNWVTALRSGMYKQGKMALARLVRKPNEVEEIEYCCLGVLCEVAGVAKTLNLLNEYVYGGYSKIYPLHWIVPLNLPADTLIIMNDTEGKSFEEIADYIEERMIKGEAA